MMASQASLALEPSSLFMVALEKRPREASPDGGSRLQFHAMLRRSVW
jgi:hypothetical protein